HVSLLVEQHAEIARALRLGVPIAHLAQPQDRVFVVLARVRETALLLMEHAEIAEHDPLVPLILERAARRERLFEDPLRAIEIAERLVHEPEIAEDLRGETAVARLRELSERLLIRGTRLLELP